MRFLEYHRQMASIFYTIFAAYIGRQSSFKCNNFTLVLFFDRQCQRDGIVVESQYLRHFISLRILRVPNIYLLKDNLPVWTQQLVPDHLVASIIKFWIW